MMLAAFYLSIQMGNSLSDSEGQKIWIHLPAPIQTQSWMCPSVSVEFKAHENVNFYISQSQLCRQDCSACKIAAQGPFFSWVAQQTSVPFEIHYGCGNNIKMASFSKSLWTWRGRHECDSELLARKPIKEQFEGHFQQYWVKNLLNSEE